MKLSGDICYAVGSLLYAALLLRLMFPTAYARLAALLSAWYWTVRGVGDWYQWRVEWERKMTDGETE